MAQAGPERQQGSFVRSKTSWGGVVLWAAVAAGLLCVPSAWNGCGFFRHGAKEFAHFVYVFAWWIAFFALRTRWRLVLLVLTVPVVLSYFGLHGIAEENAAPEAAAVSELREIRSSLQDYRNKNEDRGYPETLPPEMLSHFAQRIYRYEYVPRRDENGRIGSYVVRATPVRRDCDFPVSFTITDDGRVFFTFEPRAATTSDKVLE